MVSQRMAEQFVKADFQKFKMLIDDSKNPVDLFIEVDDLFKQSIEKAKSHKVEIDAGSKAIKESIARLKGYMVDYMGEKGIDRLDGNKFKSVTYTAASEKQDAVSKKQIMCGGKYVDLDDLNKECLVELLEKKGVKTRIIGEEVVVKKPAAIRLNR